MQHYLGEKELKLQDKLTQLDKYPFHMPGHKRNGKFNIIGSEIDITEIEGFDNLHNPTGVIADIEKDLENIYKAKKSFISVNGSSIGMLVAIHSVCNNGDKIIVARNCHKSVYNACLLLNLQIVYIEPEFDMSNGYYTRVEQGTLNTALNANPDAKAVIITSPTYEGYISKVCCDIPLIIDAAHGAHLGISYFPEYPKGDIVVSSLHKTLPALTQTAVINVYNKALIGKVKRYNDIFQTTSPSYVLMNSIAKCCDYVLNNRASFGSFYQKLCDLRLIELEHLKIKYTDDISKLIISTENADIDGVELANTLRNRFNIEPEMISSNYILLMATIGDEDIALSRLGDALMDIDATLSPKFSKPIRKPPTKNGIFKIEYDEQAQETTLLESVGKTANEFVYAYPPDIPVIIPNEQITYEAIEYITNSLEKGINIISDSSLVPNKILTKD